MKPGQPFMIAEEKKLLSMPICWTKYPKILSKKLKIPVEKIEETQKKLLYQSLLNSTPVRSNFLKEYEEELMKTVVYKRNLERVAIIIDEIKDGSISFSVSIDASHITD